MESPETKTARSTADPIQKIKKFRKLLTKGNTDKKLISKKNLTRTRWHRRIHKPPQNLNSKGKSAIAKVFRKMRFRVFHSNKIKDIIRAFLKYWVNGLCLGFVIWQIIKCTTKYIEKPQGTDVRQKKISDLPFPAITVCGDFGKDTHVNSHTGFNNTYLNDTCG